MKPIGYAIVMKSGSFVGVCRERDIAELICNKQPIEHRDNVVPLYTKEQMEEYAQEYAEQLARNRMG